MLPNWLLEDQNRTDPKLNNVHGFHEEDLVGDWSHHSLARSYGTFVTDSTWSRLPLILTVLLTRVGVDPMATLTISLVWSYIFHLARRSGLKQNTHLSFFLSCPASKGRSLSLELLCFIQHRQRSQCSYYHPRQRVVLVYRAVILLF